MFAVFLNDLIGDNIEFTDELTEAEAKMKFIEWWPRLEFGWSLIIKRLG